MLVTTEEEPMHPGSAATAARLKELHATTTPLVLPTVWDCWSARVAVDVGFTALTIGSHPLSAALGSQDGEHLELEQVFAAVRPIIASVGVPVSVDLESGYGHPPGDLVEGLVEMGAAGLNIEDTLHREGGRMRTADEHAAYVAGVREAAETAGVPLVINGRTDLFMHADDKHAVLDEAIARLRGLVEAGADTVYPVRVQSDDDLVEAVCRAMPVPVNVTAHPVADSLAHLAGLGVGRITFGPRLQAALTDYSREIESRWRLPGA
jgi:2-methylisocitrate lyase-like PEP mutase family enzyme